MSPLMPISILQSVIIIMSANVCIVTRRIGGGKYNGRLNVSPKMLLSIIT